MESVIVSLAVVAIFTLFALVLAYADWQTRGRL